MSLNVGENQRQIEATPLTASGEQAIDGSKEKSLTVSPENQAQTQQIAASSQTAQDIALASQAIASGLAGDDTTKGVGSSVVQADDTDRIEKEWVDRAKTVVERTKDDPYEQKNEMSKVKAEYIYKRFNKSMKADDAVVK